MSFARTKNYLNTFVNYEKNINFSYQNDLNLNRVKKLLKNLKIPYQKLNVIHIAGTKGKGSTAHFCASILKKSGYKVGLYTSPHFFDVRERIKVSDKDISRKDFSQIINWIRRKRCDDCSFFEIITIAAFKYFIDKKVDFVVLETGMGGRLDATNVSSAGISIITRIGYDHTDKLGTTLFSIAKEKAGIIKRKVPVISAKQPASAALAIKNQCNKLSSRLYSFGREIKVIDGKDFYFQNKCIKNLKTKLLGDHQIENASLAIAALVNLEQRGIIKKPLMVKPGVKSAFLPGRFEVVKRKPLTILDIAHNSTAFAVLQNTLEKHFANKKIILIFAASSDKNIKGMLKKIHYSKLILTQFENSRCFNPSKIKADFISDNVAVAYCQARKLYTKDSLILIAGSIFLVAQAKKMLKL
ncbi:MAG: bifunctional folylpolyglutamate synthase/dihydrofolate synthase [Candidatus Omnitrophica bacterium]|nr:bifunctional folylpolyglutamate synthase/dihydrofolate synthase [Candidatus Omnitrophota bacterium]